MRLPHGSHRAGRSFAENQREFLRFPSFILKCPNHDENTAGQRWAADAEILMRIKKTCLIGR
ncbi:hypothetical protein [Pandoraea pulmonicola]|uniref:hypothetical protein n=1 Tax=Pandoraea pulmonicola TaxID=93221 RepID=UPI0011C018EE|nr:hypothetical protein [Pandoraea pulmonicola]